MSNTNNSYPKSLVYVILSILVLVIISAFVIDKANKSRLNQPVLGHVPEFEFITSDSVLFNSDSIRGKVFVLDFIFTNCPGACPVMSANMSDLYRFYAHSDKVNFISISVDPENDTLPVLRDYARKFQVTDNRWIFLRGTIDQVVKVSEKGFMLAADDLPGGHSTKFVLIDQNGDIRGYFDGLATNVVELIKPYINILARGIK